MSNFIDIIMSPIKHYTRLSPTNIADFPTHHKRRDTSGRNIVIERVDKDTSETLDCLSKQRWWFDKDEDKRLPWNCSVMCGKHLTFSVIHLLVNNGKKLIVYWPFADGWKPFGWWWERNPGDHPTTWSTYWCEAYCWQSARSGPTQNSPLSPTSLLTTLHL